MTALPCCSSNACLLIHCNVVHAIDTPANPTIEPMRRPTSETTRLAFPSAERPVDGSENANVLLAIFGLGSAGSRCDDGLEVEWVVDDRSWIEME